MSQVNYIGLVVKLPNVLLPCKPTYEVLWDDGSYGGESGSKDVQVELLQEDHLAEVVLSTECVIDTPKQQIPTCVSCTDDYKKQFT